MNILGREFITEHMPQGWVICEIWIDGALAIVKENLSNKKEAYHKLQILSDGLITDCQRLGVTPDQYWHCHDRKSVHQLVNH